MATEQNEKNTDNIATLEPENVEGDSLWMDSLRRLSRNYMAVIGFLIIVFFILIAIFAPQIAPKDPADQELTANNAAPQWIIDLFPVMIAKGQDGGYITVSDDYILGADELGRDMLSRIIYGTRISLQVAFVGPVVALAIGLSMGLLSGYLGGRVDNIIMRVVDVFYAFPTLLLIILMMAYFRGGFSESAPPPELYPHLLHIEGLEPSGRLIVEITDEDGTSIISQKPTATDLGTVDYSFTSNKIKDPGIYTVNVRGPKSPIAEGTFTVAEREIAEDVQQKDIFARIVPTGDSDTILVVPETETGVTVTVSQAEGLSSIQSFSYFLADIDRGMGGMFFIFIGIGLTSWVGMARLTRGQVLSVREKEYIIAAESLGARKRKIMWQHVLPNILGPIIIAETLTIPVYIRYEAFLSFIGLGVNPPTPSWGSMIADGSRSISSSPFQALFPAIALFLIMFAFNFLGDGLRDALDPRMRGVD